MTVLNYFLYLVITLLVLSPFLLFMVSSIIAAYFTYKEKYTVKMFANGAKAVDEAMKKMKEKE